MLRGGSGGVGGGENGVAQGALEFDGFGEVGVSVAKENGLQMGPVPGSFALDGLGSYGDKAFVPLVQGLGGHVLG